MRKPPITGNQQQFQSQVVEMWGKVTIDDHAPDLSDMEVGEIRVLDAQSDDPTAYYVYIKPNLDCILSFQTTVYIAASYDSGYDSGFAI